MDKFQNKYPIPSAPWCVFAIVPIKNKKKLGYASWFSKKPSLAKDLRKTYTTLKKQ